MARLRRPGALVPRLPRTVVALGVVSFLTDFSSEMIYPLLPVFLTVTLGAGAVALGAVEGVAEATASLLKLVSGAWSDRTARRKPLVVAGYSLAGFARPLIGAAATWPVVLVLRFTDRIGKGLRTSPRDALIADVTDPTRRGAAFGLHRAMDHAGAVVGPLVAAALLAGAGLEVRTVFFLAAVPAAAAVLVLVLAVREPAGRAGTPGEAPASPRLAAETAGAPLAVDVPAAASAPGAQSPSVPSVLPSASPRPSGLLRGLPPGFAPLLLALAVFTLGNATDAFLLLRLSDAGIAAGWVAALWSLLHLVKMLATGFGGPLSDTWGRRRTLLAGWAVYALVYAGFAAAESSAALVALFLAYGLYFGLAEPVERAWIADLAAAGRRGTALGAYHATVGLAALPASLLFGVLWQRFGAPVAFLAGAALAGVAALLLLRVPSGRPRQGPPARPVAGPSLSP
ncbi:MAG TPA: MFS transporter [Thermoanaerobaculia bacterium]|nr:MFS transporter [Thermoanaerobaculia bacterium]